MLLPPPPYGREKLLNAIVFFVRNTRHCHKMKLFKLLFFFDFRVFRETGRPATGLEYFAWPMGPVPNALYEEIQSPRPDMKAAVVFNREREEDPEFRDPRLRILPRVAVDESIFSRREMRILKELAEVYQDAGSTLMSEATHLRGQPWHTVYEVQGKRQHPIPYLLALDGQPGSISREQAAVIAEEAEDAAALASS